MLGAKATMRGNKLIVDSKTYGCNNLYLFPGALSPKAASTQEINNTILFYTKESPFSNFHPAPFKIGLESYDQNEQYYQCKKAEKFHKDDIAQKIRNEPDPHKCKKLGDTVKYDKNEWHKVACDVMYVGALEKFRQNEHLREVLLATDKKDLAEASRDVFWATGVPIHAPNALQGWSDENHLGKILMRVRDELCGA